TLNPRRTQSPQHHAMSAGEFPGPTPTTPKELTSSWISALGTASKDGLLFLPTTTPSTWPPSITTCSPNNTASPFPHGKSCNGPVTSAYCTNSLRSSASISLGPHTFPQKRNSQTSTALSLSF